MMKSKVIIRTQKMEIQTDELERIIKFYRISDDLDFIGFRTVDPDTFGMFFRVKIILVETLFYMHRIISLGVVEKGSHQNSLRLIILPILFTSFL